MREQAALSATEITVEAVKYLVNNDSEDESELVDLSENSQNDRQKPSWEKLIANITDFKSSTRDCKDVFQVQNGSIRFPKVNGKHNKTMQHVSLMAKGESLSQGNGVAKMMHANIPMYKEVLPGLESWVDGKVASWHSLEGHSIQWLYIVCIDRRGNFSSLVIPMFSICTLLPCFPTV